MIISCFVLDKKVYAGTDSSLALTENYENAVSYVKDVDLLEKLYGEILNLSDEFIVVPLYSFSDDVSAYVIQFYDKGKEISYIVIDNRVEVEKDRIIEFGEGDFCSRFGGKSILSRYQKAKLLYQNSYDAFIKFESQFWYYNYDGYISVDNNVVKQYLGNQGSYYTFGDTLTLSDIVLLENGYTSYNEYNYSGNISSFKLMSETANAYYTLYGVSIANHCAPTAALNFVISLYLQGYTYLPVGSSDWGTTFCNLHTDMGTNNITGTLDADIPTPVQDLIRAYGYSTAFIHSNTSVGWNVAIAQLQVRPVIFCMHGSEIYGNHSVLGIGYREFVYANGWKSRYYQIFDGWESGKRYVHSQLGISDITMFYVYFW